MSTATQSSIAEPIEHIEGSELPEELLDDGGGGLVDALQTQFGTTPWWVVSVVVHVLIFLLATLLSVAMDPPVKDSVIITSPLPTKEVETYNEKLKRDIFKRPQAPMDKIIDNPIVPHDSVLDDHFETDSDMDKLTARGREDAISDVPLGGTGAVASMGVGGGGAAGVFGYRDGGGRKKAVARWGGTPGSENAVEAALKWLADHQEPDGHWDSKKYEGSMKTDAGITGLAALAFLGAGYTQKEGKYQSTVTRAFKWIISQQGADGAIGSDCEGTEPNGVGYHHSICGLALAEAYGMTKDPMVSTAAQKALDYSVNTHKSGEGGWRYTPGMAGDLSVTGWFVMQIKSGKIAGLNVSPTAFQGAMTFLDTVSNQYGHCRYKPDWLSPTPTMTSVGMLCRMFTGSAPNDPRVAGGAQYLMDYLPSWGENGSRVNMYYWYYGTLTVFQVGGEAWDNWNASLRDMLCSHQVRGGENDGSWDPCGTWATRGGRVYSTAMGALCLEVYYRYLPMYR